MQSLLINDNLDNKLNNESDIENEIFQDLNKECSGIGRISKEKLLNFLCNKLSQEKKLNLNLFEEILNNIDKNIDNTIDLKQFCKEYIKEYKNIKLRYENIQKNYENEKHKMQYFIKKINEETRRSSNDVNMNQNAYVLTTIEDINLSSNLLDPFYCKVSLKNDKENEKLTVINNKYNLKFTEVFLFPLEDDQPTLHYEMNNQDTKQLIGFTDVSLNELRDTQKKINKFDLNGDDENKIGEIQTKIIFFNINSDEYQNQYEAISNNIDKYQRERIELNKKLYELSLPYKQQFERLSKCFKDKSLQVLKSKTTFDRILTNYFDENKWVPTLKYILLFNIIMTLFTTLVKPDFIALFIFIILFFLLSIKKTNYYFKYFDIIIIGSLITIGFDIFDFLFLRKLSIDNMSSVEGWGRFFGFLSFLGKISLLMAIFIVKVRYDK